MAPRYKMRLKNASGALVAELDHWQSLNFTRRINGVDTHQFQFDGALAVVNNFILDAQVEVWRRDLAANPSIDWYLEYEGFHRTGVRQTTGDGQSNFVSYGRGYDDLLARRIILYPAGSAYTNKSGVGETVMKAYVNENAGSGATFPPRSLASGVTPGLSVQTSGGAGVSWSGSRAYRNLLEVLQEIANAAVVDFKVVGIGAALFEFRAKASPWGSDRTTIGLNPTTGLNGAGNPPVVFALGFGNMGAPVYSLNRSGEVTAAIVLGQGTETARTLVQRTDPVAIVASPWNRCEASQNATSEKTAAGLNAAGDASLKKNQARESFSFAVIQTPGRLYGRDYFFGDLVTAQYNNIERHKKIIGVSISVAQGRENIRLELADVP